MFYQHRSDRHMYILCVIELDTLAALVVLLFVSFVSGMTTGGLRASHLMDSPVQILLQIRLHIGDIQSSNFGDPFEQCRSERYSTSHNQVLTRAKLTYFVSC
jgi:hypothetical protein